MSMQQKLAIVLLCVAPVMMGCQNNGFKPIDFSEKQDFLNQKMVFEDSDITRTPLNRDNINDSSNSSPVGSDREITEVVVRPNGGETDPNMVLLESIEDRRKTVNEGTLIRPPVTNQPVPTTTVKETTTTPTIISVPVTPAVVTPTVVTSTTPKTNAGSDREKDTTPTKSTRPGSDREPAQNPPEDETDTEIKVTYLCSNKHTNSKGMNLLLSRSVKLKVDNCEDSSPEIRSNLINHKILKSSKCATQLEEASNNYSSKQPDIELIMDNGKDMVFTIGGDRNNELNIEILYHTNDQAGTALNSSVQDLIRETDVSPAGECDRRASPLFVLMDDQLKSTLSFSPITEGISFDILGRRVSHQKQQISWSNKAGLYFITLPDRSGNVKGIDQLFGDNTFGPDKRFSENGYEALRKWDDNQDGLITADDGIYSKLRLWNDADYNGVSDKSELISLEQKGVELIDLSYDKNYSETDKFGNKIMYKSVIRTHDQRLHLLFDIWFRYIPLK